VQLIKDVANQKPFWSGRIKFKSHATLALACKSMKYFEMEDYQLRLLSYDPNLASGAYKAS